jgi:hypothetical protein
VARANVVALWIHAFPRLHRPPARLPSNLLGVVEGDQRWRGARLHLC